jgi:hypothetical protein
MSWFENFVTQNLQQKIEMFKSFRHQPTPPHGGLRNSLSK